jgi:hypothetical protein
MKVYLLFITLTFQGFYSKAQDLKSPDPKFPNLVTVHAGDELSAYYTYRFPAFSDGTILFRNGTAAQAKMNFNTFLAKMQFVRKPGDTLVIAKPEEIESIRLSDRVFYYDKGYFEIMASSDSVKLVVLRKVNVDVVVTGALGIKSHTVNVGNYDSYVTPIGPRKLLINEDLSVQKEAVYSLLPKNGDAVSAYKSGFFKIFSKDKKNIETFLKSNKTDFKNPADLEKLFLFCTQSKG